MPEIKIKRVYKPAEVSDGFRILVDRLWPRGIKKAGNHFDVWMKEIAPSNELRKWFNHEPEKWEEFKSKYISELEHLPALEELLTHVRKHKTTTFVFAAKDEEHNQAVVLKEFLEKVLEAESV